MQKENKFASLLKKMHPAVLIGALCAFTFAFYAIVYPPGSNTEIATDGSVIEARTAIVYKVSEGTAKVHRDGKFIEVYEGMRLQSGDAIITEEGATIYLRVDDDTNVYIDEDSRLNVSETSSGKLHMEMVRGDCYIDAENGSSSSSDEGSFYVEGSTAMSVRDSEFITDK